MKSVREGDSSASRARRDSRVLGDWVVAEETGVIGEEEVEEKNLDAGLRNREATSAERD